MTWGVFDQVEDDAAADGTHVLPIHPDGTPANGHWASLQCWCTPSMDPDALPAFLWAHRDPLWPGSIDREFMDD